jgi:FkbM family methyltransferase
MKLLRKLLLALFGFEGYLRVISKIYLLLIRVGFLKNKYPELFFIKNIVKPGYTCIDIGANVGYYSYFLCKYSSSNGHVAGIEPIPTFRKVLMKNLPKTFQRNYELLPYALGSENKNIQMGLPLVNGVIHHGMTHILEKEEKSEIAKTFDVEMKIPDELFAHLKKIDFVKCDVEGFEYWVFSNMQQTLKKHTPIIQCELGGQMKKETIALMQSLGYNTFALIYSKLKKITPDEAFNYSNDVYFIHQQHEASLMEVINQLGIRN